MRSAAGYNAAHRNDAVSVGGVIMRDEPKGTLNTGNVSNERTVAEPDRL